MVVYLVKEMQQCFKVRYRETEREGDVYHCRNEKNRGHEHCHLWQTKPCMFLLDLI